MATDQPPKPSKPSSAPPYEQWSNLSQYRIDGIPSDKFTQNAMDLDRIVSIPSDEVARTPTAFSMDDLEVAKALTGLRAASPAPSTSTLTSQSVQPRSPSDSTRPEPLLTLLTSQHPLLSTAVHNSALAYNNTKSYSPHFRRGAEFVERNIASPVANTVNTAGRITGVETGVRWWLQRRDTHEEPQTGHKRQRPEDDNMDVERGPAHRSRAASDLSQPEFLPPYDTNRSPVYEEHAISTQRSSKPEQAPALQNWQTRFAISTSGLGVAMSEESLRSLKYCLTWLRWANTHINAVLASMQSVLSEWERSQAQLSQSPASSSVNHSSDTPVSPRNTSRNPPQEGADRPPRDPAVITSHLAALKTECVRTLKNAMEVVSTYAGGALPENARNLVKRHLTSLPLRFRIANGQVAAADGITSNDTEALSNTPEVVSGAQRVVVLAREGLDMMSQVSGVVDGTIVSAEDWCERLGKKPRQNTGPDGKHDRDGHGRRHEQVDTVMGQGDKTR